MTSTQKITKPTPPGLPVTHQPKQQGMSALKAIRDCQPVQYLNQAAHAVAYPGMIRAEQEQKWMPSSQEIPGCPPGLENLTKIDKLGVKQSVELVEIFAGKETANRYQIQNSMGQDMYQAEEKTDCFQLQCRGAKRKFEMAIKDKNGREVLHVNRLSSCCSRCLMTVKSPITGEVLGSIRKKCSFLKPKFEICDGNGQVVLNLQGPVCVFSCFSDIDFEITALNGTEVGKITKQWSGIVKEKFSDADNFGVTFPIDLDSKVKATLLGAVFLIDFMYFEK